MLAPIDKVTRKGGNDIIQVVISRSCDIFNCSECTQLLPFRRDVREMSLECIEEALICLQGWPGVIACFGGNPCTHSKFPQVCELWKKYVPNQSQRGLWTNNLMAHGRVINETFWPKARFNLNVHGNDQAKREMETWLPGIKVWGMQPSQHGGQLLDYSDFGIQDYDWEILRENCDINKNWSGGCYERDGHPYIYFCERAGSLDGVRGTNFGIRMEPGCWQWGMEKFQEQVKNCCDHYCGVPLRSKGYLDNADTYGVSRSLVQLTLPSKGKVKVEVVESLGEKSHELTDYIGLRKK